jgi:hypothetical protein
MFGLTLVEQDDPSSEDLEVQRVKPQRACRELPNPIRELATMGERLCRAAQLHERHGPNR